MNLYVFMNKYKKQIILGPLFKLIESIIELIIPIMMANIIDTGIRNRDTSYVINMGCIIGLLALLGLVAAIVCQYTAAKVSQGIGNEIRNCFFEKVNLISFSQIDKTEPSSLITRVTSDINNIQNAIAMAIRLGIRVPFITLGSLIMAYILDKELSIIFFIAIPVLSIVFYIITDKSSILFSKSRLKLDNLALLSKENLDGCRVIRAFSKQTNEIKRFDHSNKEYLSKGLQAGKIFSFMPPVAYIVVNISIIFIIWIGAIKINSGYMLPGKITAFINYITQILFAMFVASSLITVFSKAFASYKRVFEILNLKSEVRNKNMEKYINKNENTIIKPKIEFDNVTFSYSLGGESELQNLSFKAYPGETLGIIGSTGSGKTSIVNLILGFYEALSGKILIDGIKIKNYDINLLREKISIVPQNTVLFSGTIRENLTLNQQNATDEMLNHALDISQALEFVNEMPQGLNSKIERDGKNLSGGQRQRLTIARAIVTNPEILILDDSMSALDAKTSSKLKKALVHLKDTTKIIVSQKFINIKDADSIIVLDDGKIVGTGNHNELLTKCEMYKEIYNSQINKKENI